MACICNRSYRTIRVLLSQGTTDSNLAGVMTCLGVEGGVKMGQNSVARYEVTQFVKRFRLLRAPQPWMVLLSEIKARNHTKVIFHLH